MKKGNRAGDSPIGIDVLEGKSYFWCTCGISSKQPFCDGSHKGTEFSPLKYLADQSKKFFSVHVNKQMINLFVMARTTKNNIANQNRTTILI